LLPFTGSTCCSLNFIFTWGDGDSPCQMYSAMKQHISRGKIGLKSGYTLSSAPAFNNIAHKFILVALSSIVAMIEGFPGRTASTQCESIAFKPLDICSFFFPHFNSCFEFLSFTGFPLAFTWKTVDVPMNGGRSKVSAMLCFSNSFFYLLELSAPPICCFCCMVLKWAHFLLLAVATFYLEQIPWPPPLFLWSWQVIRRFLRIHMVYKSHFCDLNTYIFFNMTCMHWVFLTLTWTGAMQHTKYICTLQKFREHIAPIDLVRH